MLPLTPSFSADVIWLIYSAMLPMLQWIDSTERSTKHQCASFICSGSHGAASVTPCSTWVSCSCILALCLSILVVCYRLQPSSIRRCRSRRCLPADRGGWLCGHWMSVPGADIRPVLCRRRCPAARLMTLMLSVTRLLTGQSGRRRRNRGV